MTILEMYDHPVFLLLAQATGGKQTTLLQQINSGGTTGYIIIALSIVALAMIVIHAVSIRPARLMPLTIHAELRSALAGGQVDRALAICRVPDNDCFLTRVMDRGLTRYQRSAFGPFELKEALEEAGNEQVARLYRGTDVLGLIGSIAPMLGLLGTVLGMVGAFDTIANADARTELLAGDISKALITTMMGLSLAIPAMASVTFFRSRIDSYAAQAAQMIEELTIPLEPRGAGLGAAGASHSVPGPGPVRRFGAAATTNPAARGQTASPRQPAPSSVPAPGPGSAPSPGGAGGSAASAFTAREPKR